MRWILMKTDEGHQWVEYLGTDDEWEHTRATNLHETHEGEKPDYTALQPRGWLHD